MINENDKQNFRVSKETVLEVLRKSQYKDRLIGCCPTFIQDNEKRWRRGKHDCFEKLLLEKKLQYFSYIKFYKEEDMMYALVAGKTGSRNVNSSGSDVRFREYPKKGKAKEWLYTNRKQWCRTEILVIGTIAAEKEESKKEALEIERFLLNTFGLCES